VCGSLLIGVLYGAASSHDSQVRIQTLEDVKSAVAIIFNDTSLIDLEFMVKIQFISMTSQPSIVPVACDISGYEEQDVAGT
jgi:hypothetical protein